MITYTFAQRFVPLVQAGVMTQIFEPPRQRHARVGEPIRLISSATSRLIIDHTICAAVTRMDIVWTASRITAIREGGMPLLRLEACAKRLGYADLEDMADDLSRRHGPKYIEGFLVEWRVCEPAYFDLEVA